MKNNSSFKNFSFIAIGRVVSIALQAVFYLVFAALLEPESYGHLNYIIALAGAFALVSRFGMGYSITVAQSKEDSNLSDQINTLALVTTSLASVLLIAIDVYAAILCLGMSFFIMNQQNLLGLKKYKTFMMNEFLKNGLLIITIPIIFYFFFEIPGIVLGMAISGLVGSSTFFTKLKIQSFSNIRNHLPVLFHNFGVDASISFPRMLDKLIIAPLFGFFIVGIYQLNFQILFALEALPVALHSFLLSEESAGKTHKKLEILVLIAAIGVTILSVIFAPYFVKEFFPKYEEGIFSLQIMVLSIIPLTVSSIFSAKLQAKESTKIGYSAIVRIGTLFVLIVILGTLYDIVGLSMAVLISTILNTIFLFFLYHRMSNY